MYFCASFTKLPFLYLQLIARPSVKMEECACGPTCVCVSQDLKESPANRPLSPHPLIQPDHWTDTQKVDFQTVVIQMDTATVTMSFPSGPFLSRDSHRAKVKCHYHCPAPAWDIWRCLWSHLMDPSLTNHSECDCCIQSFLTSCCCNTVRVHMVFWLYWG